MSRLRRAVSLFPVLILFVLATSCNGFFLSNSSIESVTVTPSAVLLEAGATPNPDTYTFKANALTVGGTSSTDTNAAWSSNNAAVTVASGVVTATGSTGGVTATITASDGGQSGSANILTYTGTPPTALSVNAPSTIVSPGVPFAVTAAATLNGVSGTNITQYVTWTSSDTADATVDVNGNVTVLAAATGTFTITATANLGTAANSATPSGSTTFTVQ